MLNQHLKQEAGRATDTDCNDGMTRTDSKFEQVWQNVLSPVSDEPLGLSCRSKAAALDSACCTDACKVATLASLTASWL